MVAVVIEVFGEDVFAREMLRFGERAIDAVPAFEVIGDLFYEVEKRQFASEGQFSAGGWAPLAPSTLAQKQAHPDWAQQILERTMTMHDSLTSSGNEYSVRQITPMEMFIGSSVPYGPYHQRGVPSKNLPMRKPVELPDTSKVEMMKVLQRWIVTGVVR